MCVLWVRSYYIGDYARWWSADQRHAWGVGLPVAE